MRINSNSLTRSEKNKNAPSYHSQIHGSKDAEINAKIISHMTPTRLQNGAFEATKSNKIWCNIESRRMLKQSVRKTLFFKGARPSKLCSRFSGAHIFMFSDSSKKLEKTRPQGSSKPPKNDPKPIQQAVKKRSEKRCH